jgi:multidrug efflux pump subunit AcrA (membrane-fusion protein)
MCIDHAKARARELLTVAAAFTLLAALSDCSPQTETSAPEPRPVRTATVEKREVGVPVTLTGRIEAEDEVALAFRISGRVLENNRKLGDRLEAGQVVARLESQNERNALRAAQANLVASQVS